MGIEVNSFVQIIESGKYEHANGLFEHLTAGHQFRVTRIDSDGVLTIYGNNTDGVPGRYFVEPAKVELVAKGAT